MNGAPSFYLYICQTVTKSRILFLTLYSFIIGYVRVNSYNENA